MRWTFLSGAWGGSPVQTDKGYVGLTASRVAAGGKRSCETAPIYTGALSRSKRFKNSCESRRGRGLPEVKVFLGCSEDDRQSAGEDSTTQVSCSIERRAKETTGTSVMSCRSREASFDPKLNTVRITCDDRMLPEYILVRKMPPDCTDRARWFNGKHSSRDRPTTARISRMRLRKNRPSRPSLCAIHADNGARFAVFIFSRCRLDHRRINAGV